jgi:IS5 family transposase
VPWAKLVAVIEPVYPKSGRIGHPSIGVERMLHMYFLQQYYGLSDEGMKDTITESRGMQQCVRTTFPRGRARRNRPDQVPPHASDI